MANYEGLRSSISNINITEIQSQLKIFERKLKEYRIAYFDNKQEIHQEIRKIIIFLNSEFKKPRLNPKEKIEKENLERNYFILLKELRSLETNPKDLDESLTYNFEGDIGVKWHSFKSIQESDRREQKELAKSFKKDVITINEILKDGVVVF